MSPFIGDLAQSILSERLISAKCQVRREIFPWHLLPVLPFPFGTSFPSFQWGILTCTAEQFSLSQEEKASLLLSIHLSVQGDLLFHSSWRLSGNQWDLVLFLLASAIFSFYHICCWLLPVCCSLQPSAKTNILTAARGSLDWHIIKGSKGHISRLK